MSQRKRGIALMGVGEIRPISDASKLLWERYWGPMNAAAAQFNAAVTNTQNILAAIIIEREGLSPETHVFDMDKLRIVPRPRVKGGGNGAVDK